MQKINYAEPSCALVADNIYQVRLPLPFALNHVNCYVLHDPNRNQWTVVDTGLSWDGARDAWQWAFDQLPISAVDIDQIVLTHIHPDHFGLAGWLHKQSNAPIYLSSLEWEMAQTLWLRPSLRQERVLKHWSQHGVQGESAKIMASMDGKMRERTLPHPLDGAVHLIEYDTIFEMGGRKFRTIHAPGHSTGQMLFHDENERLMLSGDHVLMKITPNVGLWPDGVDNPLNDYVTSLGAIQSLDVNLALPVHRALITDWAGRAQEIIHHHDIRLDKMLSTVDDLTKGTSEGTTALEVSKQIFDYSRFTDHEVRFAVAETLAHLVYLVDHGRLQEIPGDIVTYRL
ncbi:MAG: MBL fold metallo-hydrolase [Chloroflexota bacterium]